MLGNNERHSEKIKWYISVWSSSNFEVDINNIYFIELIMITILTTFKIRKRQQNINIQQKILFYQKMPFSTTISNLNKFNTIIRNFEIVYFKKVHWNFYSYSVILQTTFVILAELISSQDLTCVWVTGEKTVSFIIFNAALILVPALKILDPPPTLLQYPLCTNERCTLINKLCSIGSAFFENNDSTLTQLLTFEIEIKQLGGKISEQCRLNIGPGQGLQSFNMVIVRPLVIQYKQ